MTFMIENRTPVLGNSSVTVGGLISAVLFGVGLFMLRNNPKSYRGALKSKSGFMLVIFAWLIFTLTFGLSAAVVWVRMPAIFAGGGVAALLFAIQLTLDFRKLRHGTPPRPDATNQL